MSDRLRCGLCSAPISSKARDCRTCDLGWEGAPPSFDDDRFVRLAARSHIRLTGGLARFEGLLLSFQTLRSLASRFDRVAALQGAGRLLFGRLPSRWLSADIALSDGPNLPSKATIALGCIARAQDVPALEHMAAEHAEHFDVIAVMIDDSPGKTEDIRRVLQAAAGRCVVRVDSYPLDRDFGAQRNRAQKLAGTDWVLQLDTDEMPDARLAANLRWIVADAEAHGDKVVGFPRLNLVDGRPSAFYPDRQYRLMRSNIAFTGKVHETPIAGLHWRRIHHSLAGGIEHRLSRERVVARSLQYEAIAAGGGKPDDERQLLEPWPAIPAEIVARKLTR